MSSKWAPATKAAASMSANRSKGSVPEELLRLAAAEALPGEPVVLHDRGLPGRPDMAFPLVRVAVFMHGCYWHSCPSCFPEGPEARKIGGPNSELWSAKFVANRERFERAEARLTADGWAVLTLWECTVLALPLECAEAIRAVVENARAAMEKKAKKVGEGG